jgi:hypothetical protein
MFIQIRQDLGFDGVFGRLSHSFPPRRKQAIGHVEMSNDPLIIR